MAGLPRPPGTDNRRDGWFFGGAATHRTSRQGPTGSRWRSRRPSTTTTRSTRSPSTRRPTPHPRAPTPRATSGGGCRRSTRRATGCRGRPPASWSRSRRPTTSSSTPTSADTWTRGIPHLRMAGRARHRCLPVPVARPELRRPPGRSRSTRTTTPRCPPPSGWSRPRPGRRRTSPDALPPSRTAYRWRIVRFDGSGDDNRGRWSELGRFFVDRQDVTLRPPHDGALQPPNGPVLNWEPFGAGSDQAAKYAVDIRNSSGQSVGSVSSTAATAWAPTVCYPSGTYSWKVTAYDASGNEMGKSPTGTSASTPPSRRRSGRRSRRRTAPRWAGP